ncbi:MAG: hypothetical protein VKL41_03975 [Snowella sp.]|nr:hypothetical protein [Snowella sp.]
MSKRNKLSNHLSEIRRRFHNKFLTEELVTEINFSYEDKIKIIEDKHTGSDKLKTVIINNFNTGKIPETMRIEKIWQVNLEMIIQTDKLGLSVPQQPSTSECVLIILTKSEQNEYYNMNICLIELKTNINLNILQQLIKKIRSNMNIMYLFLTLNNHSNPDKGYENKTIKINFKGIIFHNKTTINENKGKIPVDPTEIDLLKIIKGNCENNLLQVSTFLNEKDKIEIKFFKNPNKDTDEMEVSIQDLIT